MDWHPLRLTTPVKRHVFGGRALAGRWGRTGLPDAPVAETWEVSDVDGQGATVTEGPLAGRTLRHLAEEYPDELIGRGRGGALRLPGHAPRASEARQCAPGGRRYAGRRSAAPFSSSGRFSAVPGTAPSRSDVRVRAPSPTGGRDCCLHD
jgi:hypothetical protein